MLSERELSAAIGSTAYDGGGDKIGTVEHFFVDDRTGAPTWVAVATGLFGTRHSVVPAVDATFTDGGLRLPVTVASVRSAPHVAGDHLDPAEEDELRRHYGVGSTTGVDDAAPTQEIPSVPPPVPTTTESAGPNMEPTTERATASDGSLTRSEERLRAGTERVARTRARLVKYIVTEEVQITVPIRREEIRIEEVPLDHVEEAPGEFLVPAGSPGSDGQSSQRAADRGIPDEIILHTERPVVTVEVVPTERVRLRTELVQGQETVTGQVQREEIVVDQDRVAVRDAPTERQPPR